MAVHQVAGEYHRLHRHAELLHGRDAAHGRVHGSPGGLLHSEDNAALQADAALAGLKDPHSYVQGFGQGADPAGLLPRPGHRVLRQSGVLRREVAGEVPLTLIKKLKIYYKILSLILK